MRLFILLSATFLSYSLLAQDEKRFRNFHGIKHPQNNVHYFEGEGYDIFIQSIDLGMDEKGMARIRKKYSMKDGQLGTDSLLNLKVLTNTEQKNGVTAHVIHYLIPESAKRTTVIGFVKMKKRDITLERDFVKSHLSNQIPAFIFTDLSIDSIDFVGRTITLGPVCRWMSPHNIQCPNYGQMNWTIFDNLKSAEDYRDAQFEMAKAKNLMDVKEEKWIMLKFEGQETKALKTKMKIQLPKMITGGSNILVVYYVTGHVRGKYVTCVLSHYTDDLSASTLPPLLAEVLELVE
jgi:hypothetical protein